MSSSSSPEVEQEVYPDGSSSSSSSSGDPPMASPINDTQLPPMDEPDMDENDVKEIVAGTDPVWYFLAFVLVAALFIYLVFYRRKGNTSEEDDDFFATLDIEKVCNVLTYNQRVQLNTISAFLFWLFHSSQCSSFLLLCSLISSFRQK
jgi:hypothetical protein